MNPAPAVPPIDLAALLARAREAAGRAHAPYSGYRVGAAIATSGGIVFTGCNVENASYGLTLCAERCAVGTAVAEEGPGLRIVALAVAVEGARPFPPCGACRQVVAEFASPDAPVIYAGNEGDPVCTTLGALLPQAFGL